MPQYGKSFTEVENEEKEALTENEQMYDDMISDSDKYYQAQIDASKEWADKQTELQQERTDFTIEQINQQKEWAEKDYTKEQSAAYTDWQKQSNKYGAKAEQEAASGLSGTGFSESSQVSMYNTYQNRVATARESYQRAIVNYDMAIKDARLQNNSILAEIAYEALQTQLQLSLEGFQYKNTLILDKAATKRELKSFYHQQWQDVLNQINTENSLAQSASQFAAQMEFNREQFEYGKTQDALDREFAEKQFEYGKTQDALDREFDREQFEWQKGQANKTSSSGGGSGGSGSGGVVLKPPSGSNTATATAANPLNSNGSLFPARGTLPGLDTTNTSQMEGFRNYLKKDFKIDHDSLKTAGVSKSLSDNQIIDLVEAGILGYYVTGNGMVHFFRRK